jgi:maltose-binding protein MalE
MNAMKPFQLIFVSVFIIILIVAVFVFANSGSKNSASSGNSAPVVIWGTFPSSIFTSLEEQLSNDQKATLNISYVQKDPSTFQTDLLEALADGDGPDVLLLPQGDLMQNINRIYPIPYSSYPERQYDDTFIPEGQLFETHAGYAAIPFLIDPMVMYWNKDTLIAANQPLPPKYWDQVVGLVPTLSQIDESGTISKSTIPLGEYSNVQNAKDILSLLFFQAGDPIATYTYDSEEQKDVYATDLKQPPVNGSSPAEDALNFYTQFSDPVKTTYTWNGSLASSTDEFLSGESAFYLGFASEMPDLQNKNPNLNFDVTTVPQSQSTGKTATFGELYGLAVLKSSTNQSNSIEQIYTLTSSAVLQDLLPITGLPPVRLTLLQGQPASAAMGTFYAAALQSEGWLDIDPDQTDGIFENMIESVTSGSAEAADAVTTADLKISSLIPQTQ